MEENSIKEDIEKVEDFIDIVSVFLQKYGTKIPKKIIDQKSYIAIQHILSDYKRVLKENEELNEKILDNAGIYQLGFKDGEESYIKKVKDKIEELNREIGKSIDNSKGGLDEEFIEKARELLVQKRILQELLEGRKI